ncbi:MAG: hypothetical protein AB7H90_02535 [Alphaproteobacteria bacterium]
MATVQEEIEAIIEEFTRLQTAPAPYRDKNDDFPLPRVIGAGNGGSIIVSQKIDDAIVTVADQLMTADASLSPKVTRAEWRALVRGTFGPALAMIDLDIDLAKNADTVLIEIRTMLSKHVSGYGVREFAFGCTLFGNGAVQPFSIGPVRFESRLDWLARKSGDGAVSATTHRRIERAWSGKHPKKRKPSIDSICETDILDTVGSCPFVCSVTITGLAAEAGREKALTAARLAIAAIALLWVIPSRALEGMNLLFDYRTHRQKALSFIPGKIVLAGFRLSHTPHGPWLKNGEWEGEFVKYEEHFRVVGEVLDYVIDVTGNTARPKMMNTLAQALLWFHEGCREIVTLMAIVKYSAVLDALACGGKSGGIRRLLNARLGIQDNTPIRPNGPTLKQAVEEIYKDGRSRTIHGTNVKLGHDWSETKGLAEHFARLCLLHCIDWAAQNPSLDDPKQLSQ